MEERNTLPIRIQSNSKYEYRIAALPFVITLEHYYTGFYFLYFVFLLSSLLTIKVRWYSLFFTVVFASFLLKELFYVQWYLLFVILFVTKTRKPLKIDGSKLKLMLLTTVLISVFIKNQSQLAFVFAWFVVVIEDRRRLHRFLFLAMAAIVAHLCGSRTVLVFIVAMISLLLFKSYFIRNIRLIFSVFIGLILYGMYYLQTTKFYDIDLVEIDERLYVWKLQLDNLDYNAFIFGTDRLNLFERLGSNNISSLIVEEAWNFIHNDYLSLLLLKGVIGLVVFYVCLARTFASFHNTRKYTLLLGLSILMLFDNFTFYPSYVFVLMFTRIL